MEATCRPCTGKVDQMNSGLPKAGQARLRDTNEADEADVLHSGTAEDDLCCGCMVHADMQVGRGEED